MENTLTIRLLGSFRATINAVPLHFRSDKTQALFIYLLLNEGTPTRRDLLATLLWPNNPEDRARKNLTDAVFHLRKALDQLAPNFSKQHLISRRKEIHFLVSECVVVDTAQLDATNAVELVEGELCAGFYVDEAEPFIEWLLITREQWYLRSLALLGEQTERWLENKQAQDALRGAQKQLNMEPWRESAHQQALRAFALAEDWTGLEKQFADCQAILMEELGVEPSKATLALYESLRPKRVTPHNLPVELSPFFGRKTELSRINSAIDKGNFRLFTLTGIGGSGKTRLAIEIGRQQLDHFPDGVWFVPLASIDRVSALLPTVAEAINLPLNLDTPIEQQLYTYLAEKSLLLILDNLEQLPPESADVIFDLLNHTKRIVILTTSRSRLNLRVENIFPIDGLEVPDEHSSQNLASVESVSLFLEQSARVRLDQLAKHAYPTVGEICRLLSGSPLGIELAAARTDTQSVKKIAQTLRNSIATLATTMRDIPPRQRSIRAVFDYSWRLLSKKQKQGLAQLSIFRQPFSWEAAQNVARITRGDLLTLIKSSWLSIEENGTYRFHELLREFGQEQLTQDAHWQAETNRRYINYHLNLLRDNESALAQDLTGQVLALLRQSRVDFTNAWQLAIDARQFDELCESSNILKEMYWHSGLLVEATSSFDVAINKVRRIVAAPNTPPAALKLLAILLLAHVYFREETAVDATILQTSQEAFSLAQQLGDEKLMATARLSQAHTLFRLRKLDDAYTIAKELAELAERNNDRDGRIEAYDLFANVYGGQNQFALAERYYRLALNLLDENEAPLSVAKTRHNLSALLGEMGRYDEAARLLNGNLDLWERSGRTHYLAITHEGIGDALLRQGHYDLALPHLQLCLRHYMQVHDLDGVANTQAALGRLSVAVGDLVSAEKHYRTMLEARQQMAGEQSLFGAWAGLARVALLRGQLNKAIAFVNRIVPNIMKNSEEADVSFGTYLICHQTLVEASDPWAQRILEIAIRKLHKQADMITDPAAKDAFLNNVQSHRELLKLAQGQR